MSFFDEADEPRTAPRQPRVDAGPPGVADARRATEQAIQVRARRRAGRPPDRGDPDRGRRPQLPGQRAQQLAEGLQQQRRVADPAVRRDRQQVVQRAVERQRIRRRGKLQNQINQTPRDSADNQLSKAKELSVPTRSRRAQQYFVLALQMRSDGIANIAKQIQPALGNADEQGRDLLDRRARWPGSTRPTSCTRTTAPPQIAGALHAAGIAVGGANGADDQREPVPPRPQLADPVVRRRPSSTCSTRRLASRRQDRPRPARPLAELGQRRRHHAADRLDQHDPGQPAADVHAELHQRRHRTTRPTSSARCRSQRHRAITGQTIVPQTTAGQTTTCEVTLSLAAARELHREGDDRAGPGREEHRQQHADVPGHVPVDRAWPGGGPPTRAYPFARCTT